MDPDPDLDPYLSHWEICGNSLGRGAREIRSNRQNMRNFILYFILICTTLYDQK